MSLMKYFNDVQIKEMHSIMHNLDRIATALEACVDNGTLGVQLVPFNKSHIGHKLQEQLPQPNIFKSGEEPQY